MATFKGRLNSCEYLLLSGKKREEKKILLESFNTCMTNVDACPDQVAFTLEMPHKTASLLGAAVKFFF